MDLNQVTIPSIDLTKSILFYQNLGLNLVVKSLPHYARFECPDGDSTFSIQEVEVLPWGEGIYIYFECEDLDEKVHGLIKKGIDFDELPEDKSWLWREARLTDPDGNKIILFYGGENRKNPPWKVND